MSTRAPIEPSDGEPHSASESATAPTGRVWEVAAVFLRLGLTAFGGPAAHISAMEDDVVTRRRWLSRDAFLDLVSASNIIPGPNSTELAIHLGFQRAGWRGLLVAGGMFIGPTTLLVWLLAMAYVRYGARPEVHAMVAGMQPVVLAVVAQALWRLMAGHLRVLPLTLTVAATTAVLLGVPELTVLGAAAIAGMLLLRRPPASAVSLLFPAALTSVDTLARGGSAAVIALATLPTVGGIFGSFLKIGSVLFGSGYVLLAFLRSEFVERQAWLTEGQLLDAIAIGQITPGPLFSSATFIGYLLAGHGGAAAATIGIFLPAFLFVAVSRPLVRAVRRSALASAALDGVNAGSLALLVAVSLVMLRSVATSPLGIGIFLVSAILLIRWRIGAGWMLLAGAAVGLVRAAIA